MRMNTAVLLTALLPSLAVADAAGLSDKALATAESLRNQAMQGTEAFAIVESLTTEIGPRMGGSPEYDRATAWATGEVQNPGLRQRLAATGDLPGLAAASRKCPRAEPIPATPDPDGAGRQREHEWPLGGRGGGVRLHG